MFFVPAKPDRKLMSTFVVRSVPDFVDPLVAP